MFFLPQTLVECPAEAAALESEYLRAAELPQAGLAPLLQPAAVAAVALQPELRAVETPRPLSDGSLKQHPTQSRNTTAAVAGKSTFWSVFALLLLFLPYQNHRAPGTPLSDSLLISKEIL